MRKMVEKLRVRGLRIILDGNDVEELGVDERLAFEV
jgi:hypothetical protein